MRSIESASNYVIGASSTSLAGEPKRVATDSERSRDRAKALADATPPKLRCAYARTFVAETVSRYWAKLSFAKGRAPKPFDEAPLKPSLRADALAVADHVAELAAKASIEDAAYLIGRIYASMLPEDVRSKNGVYYTPPALATRLLSLAQDAGVDWARARVLDPSCGGGAFLGPIARLMLRNFRDADKRVVLRSLSTRLRGFEIDPFAAWLTRAFLDATLCEELGFVGGDEFEPVIVCDSLTRVDSPAEFDLVIGNPPYGRVTLDAKMRAAFKRSLYGHANLYGVFMDLALRLLKPEGTIAFVAPTSFLSGEYFRNLRELLAASAPALSLDFVSRRSRVFDDVLQETILATFKQRTFPQTTRVHFLDVGSTTVSASSSQLIPTPATSEPWIVPRSAESVALVGRLLRMPTRLSDWGYQVSTGPLVWNRYKDQMRDKAIKGAVPLIWAESVSADGVFSFRAARRNHAPYFLVPAGEEWLLIRRPCVLLQRTTAKEQPRRLVAAELPQAFLDEHQAVTVENHLNMLVPIVDSPKVASSVVAAFLNSAAADRVFRCISGSVAVSAYELEAMPLPSVLHMEALKAAVKRRASRETLDSICDELYGAA